MRRPASVRTRHQQLVHIEGGQSNVRSASRSVRYTDSENAKITAMRADGHSWDAIMRHFPTRTTSSVRAHYNQRLQPRMTSSDGKRHSGKLTAEDKTLIVHLREQMVLSWPDIAQRMGGLKPFPVSQWYNRTYVKGIDRSTLPKPLRHRTFTPEEDEKILTLRDQGMSWHAIHTVMPQRSVKSLGNRFCLYLRPEERLRQFAEQEDNLIIEMRAKGATFNSIAQQLAPRTMPSVYYRWSQYLMPGAPRQSYSCGYTNEEDATILATNRSNAAFKELAKQMPGRSWGSLSRRHSVLKLREIWPKYVNV